MTNVILLTLDCFRKDFFKKEITPYLWELAKKGIVFENAYSTGPWSPPSIKGILTSTYPLMHNEEMILPDRVATLAEILKKEGYKTAAFTLGGWLSPYFKFVKGYDYISCTQNNGGSNTKSNLAKIYEKIKSYFYKIFPSSRKIYRIIYLLINSFKESNDIDKPQIESVLNWIDENKNNKFHLWMHLEEGHEPYFKGGNFIEKVKLNYNQFNIKKKYDERDVKIIKKMYAKALRGVDNNVHYFIEKLKEKKVFDNSYIIICGDHGQGLYERGYFGHWPKFYDENIHVPLVIIGPNIKIKNEKKVVSLLDISPTILNILGIDKPESFLGKNILIENREYAISEDAREQNLINPDLSKIKYDLGNYKVAVINEGYKCIYDGKNYEMYNLKKDASEKKEISLKNKEIFESLKSKIKEHMEFEVKKREEEKNKGRENNKAKDVKIYSKEEEEAIKKRLEKLGYI